MQLKCGWSLLAKGYCHCFTKQQEETRDKTRARCGKSLSITVTRKVQTIKQYYNTCRVKSIFVLAIPAQ
eukprot:scaffold3884_cov76-Cyclotella_meneghiniana.AAC.2